MRERHTTTLGQRIRMARQAAGIAQAKLGLLAGIEDFKNASVRMNRYEVDKTSPDIATVRAIADALGVPAAFLITEDDDLALLILAIFNMSDLERRKFIKSRNLNLDHELIVAVADLRRRLKATD